MNKKRIGIGVLLGFVTALLCLVLTDSLLKTGREVFWGPAIAKENPGLTSFLRPALLGFFLSLFLSNSLVQVERSARFVLALAYLAVLVLVLVIPAIAVFCGIEDGMVWWYGAGLALAASLMWNVILKRREPVQKAATP